MEPRAKKRLFNTLRIVLCVAALAIVIQGVTIRDHVVLKDQEAVFVMFIGALIVVINPCVEALIF